MANIFKRIASFRAAGTGGEVMGNVVMAQDEATPVVREHSRWLMGIIKYTILAVIFLVPLAYLPATQDALFIKIILAEVAAVIVGAAWLLDILVAKKIEYKRNPLNLVFLAVALVMIAGTIFSRAPWFSFWGSDITGEKTASILALMAISFITASVFTRKDVMRAANLILTSFILLGLFSLISAAAMSFGRKVPEWMNINPVGTVFSLAYVLAAGFLFAFVLVLAAKTSRGRTMISQLTSGLAWTASAVLFAAMIFIGFKMTWLSVALALAFVVALSFVRPWTLEDGTREFAISNFSTGVAFAMMVLAIFIAFKPLTFITRSFQPPPEISPSLGATLSIGFSALKDHPLTGYGPANFRIAYNMFRDSALNNTNFWAARFNHGYSFMATMLSTMGILGVAVFTLFALAVLGVAARAIWKMEENAAHMWAFWAGSVLVVAMWFLYASNFTASFVLFVFLGLLGAMLQEPLPQAERAVAPGAAGAFSFRPKSWFRITRKAVQINSPAVNFVTSLAAVFMAAFSLVALYSLVTQDVAEVYFNRASQVMNLYGNTNTASIFLDKAIGYNPVDDNYYLGKAQVALVSLNQIIGKVAAGSQEDLAGQFRDTLTQGVTAAQKARDISPTNPQNWFTLGQLYESVAPYLPGADKSALDSYQKARDNDPTNPLYPLAMGRVYLTLADILTLQINQTSNGDDRSRLEQIRHDAWGKSREALGEAVKLKTDFAQAHFLLAQVSIRENNLSEAIRNTENTALLAPGDIGVAFQLGVLYYRAGDLDKAKTAFDRAVLLNDNYSNARYFLGLIWDRKGDRDAALSQFVKILALNPGSEEVKRIVANLEAGKPALTDIVPPAPAPENRKEAPIKEEDRNGTTGRAGENLPSAPKGGR